jgi:hypothetical protein
LGIKGGLVRRGVNKDYGSMMEGTSEDMVGNKCRLDEEEVWI